MTYICRLVVVAAAHQDLPKPSGIESDRKVSESTARRLERQVQECGKAGDSLVIHYVSGVDVRGSPSSLAHLSDSEMRSYTR